MELINNQPGQKYAQVSPNSNTPSRSIASQEGEGDDSSLGVVNNPKNVEAVGKNSSDRAVQNPQEIEGTADVGTVAIKERDLEDALNEVESFLQVQNRNLSFTIDEETQRSIVTVKDAESGEVIRQIPSEEVLKLAERIQDLQQDIGSRVGVLFSKHV